MTRLLSILIISIILPDQIFVPVQSKNRSDVSTIQLTDIGQFGLIRKARVTVPGHIHTGIDIKRPNSNYTSEPIFPIGNGMVISKRTDGPYANLIIEHEIKGSKIWSLYEHISGIRVNVNDVVNPDVPIARFMNREELNRYGWQFDHFHLEIMKVKPMKITASNKNPERFYNSYTLICHTPQDLNKYYVDPFRFFNYNINK